MDHEDICGLCFEPGANKMAMWTGSGAYRHNERHSETEFVHQKCEEAETQRAFEEGV